MSIKNMPSEGIIVILAIAGGLARYLNLYLNGEKFRLSMLVANLILSGFAGLMFSLFGKSLGLATEFTYVLSGVGGFMSTEALKFLAQRVKKI